MPYKVLRKLKHNGKMYDPAPDVTAKMKKAGPEGPEYHHARPAGWSLEELKKAGQVEAPTLIEDGDIGPAEVLQLISSGTIERIEPAPKGGGKKGDEKKGE